MIPVFDTNGSRLRSKEFHSGTSVEGEIERTGETQRDRMRGIHVSAMTGEKRLQGASGSKIHLNTYRRHGLSHRPLPAMAVGTGCSRVGDAVVIRERIRRIDGSAVHRWTAWKCDCDVRGRGLMVYIQAQRIALQRYRQELGVVLQVHVPVDKKSTAVAHSDVQKLSISGIPQNHVARIIRICAEYPKRVSSRVGRLAGFDLCLHIRGRKNEECDHGKSMKLALQRISFSIRHSIEPFMQKGNS